MKITDIRATTVTVPLEAPLRHANGCHWGRFVRTIVEACLLRVESTAGPGRTTSVVLAAPTEEYHDLGLRMLADRFTLAGWRALFLGADVPLPELLTAVAELDACLTQLAVAGRRDRIDFLIEKQKLSSLTDEEKSELRQLH